LFQDPLSYSGRTSIFPPLFYYLIAGFSLLMPLELTAKIIPSFGFAALALVIYLIAKQLTKNKIASLIAALFAGFVPILYSTISQISVYAISLPLIFLLSYFFLRIEEKGFASWSIILAVILLLTNPSVIMLLISCLLYLLIIRLEKEELNRKEMEMTLFLFFLALWFNLLLYKKAFFLHGIKFIWENLPALLLSSYFKDISFLGIIYIVGVLPLILGVYAVYHVFFKTRSKGTTLYVSFAIISFIMLWLKLIPFQTGLLFLSLNLIILSAYTIKIMLVSTSKTKAATLPSLITGLLVLFFILTTTIPLINVLKTTNIPPQGDIKALEWMRDPVNTENGSVVLGRVEEGYLINYIAERKNIADLNFMLIQNIDQRYSDINHLYTLRLKSEAVRLLNDYNINYILLSSQSMKEYNITKLYYADQDCFERIYDEEAIVYKFLGCEIK